MADKEHENRKFRENPDQLFLIKISFAWRYSVQAVKQLFTLGWRDDCRLFCDNMVERQQVGEKKVGLLVAGDVTNCDGAAQEKHSILCNESVKKYFYEAYEGNAQ